MGFGICVLGIPKPRNVISIFGSWLNGLPKYFKPLVLVGAAALCYPHQLSGESTSGDGDQASGSSNKVPGRSTAHDASEHINLALSIERDADE